MLSSHSSSVVTAQLGEPCFYISQTLSWMVTLGAPRRLAWSYQQLCLPDENLAASGSGDLPQKLVLCCGRTGGSQVYCLCVGCWLHSHPLLGQEGEKEKNRICLHTTPQHNSKRVKTDPVTGGALLRWGSPGFQAGTL